jgi:2-oxoisovalerate dehydrogenase E1 component beta subunit
VAVSWAEAFDRVAAELRRVYAAHGPRAVFGGSYGWASAGRFHDAQHQIHRFLNLAGGYVRSVNSYSSGAASVILPHVIGPQAAVAGRRRLVEDVGRKGGVFGATDGLYAKFGEARVLDTPLAESGIVGVAIGAALNGLIPIAEIQFADFIHPAFDQIVSEAARTRYRSNGDWSVPIVIRAPFGGGVHGGLYHSQSVEAFYAHVPGLKVVVPSMPADAKGLLKSAIRDPDPVLFLEHKKVYRLVSEEVPDGDHLVPIGPALVRREGTRLSCFAWGLMTHYCLQAAEQLAAGGISVEVVDLRCLAPLDRETILESVRKTGKAMIVHEDNLTGGFGAEVAAIISEHAFDSLDGPVVRVAGPDIPAMPFNNPQEEFFMPNPAKIAEAMKKLAAY